MTRPRPTSTPASTARSTAGSATSSRCSPEYATFLGMHDHDGDLSSGGRDAIDEEVAFYRRTIDELSAFDPGELSTGARARP